MNMLGAPAESWYGARVLHLIDAQAARLLGVDLPPDDSRFMSDWHASPYTALPPEKLKEIIRREVAAAARMAVDCGVMVVGH